MADFKVLDINGDGQVSKQEMLTFLAEKHVDEEHRTQIVDELFSVCDINGSGYVDLNEFSMEYLKTRTALQKREHDLQAQLKMLTARINNYKREMESLQRSGAKFQGPVGTLNVFVKSVKGLPAQTQGNPYVIAVQQGNMQSKTSAINGQNPTINE